MEKAQDARAVGDPFCNVHRRAVFEDFYTDLFIAAQKIEISLVVGSPGFFHVQVKRPGEISQVKM